MTTSVQRKTLFKPFLGMETYKYDSIDNAPVATTRLFRFLPKEGGTIRGSLCTVRLRDRPKYICLSYTWRDPLCHDFDGVEYSEPADSPRIEPIECDGQIIFVTKSLKDALDQLSKSAPLNHECYSGPGNLDSVQYIWIDGICIDQDNKTERSYQVSFMCQIYTDALSVTIWLGPADLSTEDAIKTILTLAKCQTSHPYLNIPLASDLRDQQLYKNLGIQPIITIDEWTNYATFLMRPWFSRIWVVQEFHAASAVIVLCGDRSLSWEALTLSSRLLNRTCLGELLNKTVADALSNIHRETLYVEDKLKNQLIMATMKEQAGSLTIERLCNWLRFFQATDPRDLVYGLLGIWNPSMQPERQDFIKPNYVGASVASVFTEFSWAMIKESGNLDLLSLVDNASFVRNEDLPSWVPDLSAPLKIHLLRDPAQPSTLLWNASKGFVFEVPSITNSLQLAPKGLQVGTITETGPTFNDLMFHYELPNLLELMVRSLPQEANSTGTAWDCWCAMIKGTFGGQPVQSDSLPAFSALVAQWVLDLEENIRYPRINDSGDTSMSETASILSPPVSESIAKHDEVRMLITQLHKQGSESKFPTWEAIQHIVSMANLTETDEQRKWQDVSSQIQNIFQNTYGGRRLFRTDTGYVGLSPETLTKGDVAWIVVGASTPIVLRGLASGNYKVVGGAYMHGIMNGEVVDGVEEDQLVGICLE